MESDPVGPPKTTDRRLACGFVHSLAIAGDPLEVYVWGRGDLSPNTTAGPLGRNCERETNQPQLAGAFISPCISVHASNRYSVLVHENGSLTMWAAPPRFDYQEAHYLYEDMIKNHLYWGSSVPRHPASRQIKASVVACGSDHILLADILGRTFSWGSGGHGVLGHGSMGDVLMPALIVALKEQFITGLAAGSRHSMCCTADGSMYSWGNGENSKLGHGDTVGRSIPSKIEVTFLVSEVACGESHSACISTFGELYLWGSSSFGRLGLGFESGELSRPSKLGDFDAKNEIVTQISLGITHSACITQEKVPSSISAANTSDMQSTRKLYVWGGGSNGKLGPASLDGSNVVSPRECFSGYVGFNEVCCGPSHTLVSLLSGEILSMGPDGATWLGKRKKESELVSLSDFVLDEFISKSNSLTSLRKAGYTSASVNKQDKAYVVDYDDADRPSLTVDQIARRDEALLAFIERGEVPMIKGTMQPDASAVQLILWSRPWNGEEGVSETALALAQDELADKRYRIRAEYAKLEDLVYALQELSVANKQKIHNYFTRARLGQRLVETSPDSDRLRSERSMRDPATRDPMGLLSARDSFGGGTARKIPSNAWRFSSSGGLSCFPFLGGAVINGTSKSGVGDDEEFFSSRDFECAGTLLSHLLVNPERVLLLWTSLKGGSQKREDELQLLFFSLCRDLYNVEDKASQRFFHRLVQGMGPVSLQQIAGMSTKTQSGVVQYGPASHGNSNDFGAPRESQLHVSAAEVFRDGAVPRLLNSVYLQSRKIRSYIGKRVQPLLDRLMAFDAELDLDPFTVAISLEVARAARQNSSAGGLVYLRPFDDKLPLDLQEANLRRQTIFETKSEVRKALEPKWDVLTTLIELTSGILSDMCSSLPHNMGAALAEYYRSVMWYFYPNESKESCTLAIVRTLFHLTVVPALAKPEMFEMSVPSKDISFNTSQLGVLLDRCFADSRQVFGHAWFGPLNSVARRFRSRLANETLIKSMQPSVVSGSIFTDAVTPSDVAEADALDGIIAEKLRVNPLVIFPTRRTLEFTRHRVAPFLSELPSLEDDSAVLSSRTLHTDASLTDSIHHFLGIESEADNLATPGSSRRLLYSASRSLSRSRSRLFKRSASTKTEIERKKAIEEERRINYWDFVDDWGFAVPVDTPCETLDSYMQRRGERKADDNFRTEASEVVSRVTEMLLNMSIPADRTLWDVVSQHMPDAKPALLRYALLDASKPMDDENAKLFALNILAKVLDNQVERLKTRISVDYSIEVLDRLLVDVKMGIVQCEEQIRLLHQFSSMLIDGNAFTQNRKAVESFASQAGIRLTPVVKMEETINKGKDHESLSGFTRAKSMFSISKVSG